MNAHRVKRTRIPLDKPLRTKILALWPTETGWSAVIPMWRIDLEIAQDGSRSTIDANSVNETDISRWRNTVAPKVSAKEWTEVIQMASQIRWCDSFSHHLLLMEDRVVTKQEFLAAIARFAQAMSPTPGSQE